MLIPYMFWYFFNSKAKRITSHFILEATYSFCAICNFYTHLKPTGSAKALEKLNLQFCKATKELYIKLIFSDWYLLRRFVNSCDAQEGI